MTAFLLFTLSCKKQRVEPEVSTNPPEFKQPVMSYENFDDVKVSTPNFGYHVDMDGDGNREVTIQVKPIGSNDRYELQFAAATGLNTYLYTAIDGLMDPLEAKTTNTTENTITRGWYNLAYSLLMNQITPISGNGAYWQGAWRNLNHKYFGFLQKRADGNSYLGWFEISTNAVTGYVQIHRAAISTEPNKPVKTGL